MTYWALHITVGVPHMTSFMLLVTSLKPYVPLEAPSDLWVVPIDHSGSLRHLPVALSHLLEAQCDLLGVPCDPQRTPSDLLGVQVTPYGP